MSEIELSIVNEEVGYVGTDLLILKHASGFFGVDKIVADIVTDNNDELSLDKIAECIDTDGYFLVNGNDLIQAREILFVKSVRLNALHYNQIYNFVCHALKIASKVSDNTCHIAMTIHGVGYGLNTSITFLAQIAAILYALNSRNYPSKLKGISIVEIDAERAQLLSKLLAYRFKNEPYARFSISGNVLYIDEKELWKFYKEPQISE